MSLAFDDLFENRVEKLDKLRTIEDAEEDDRVFDQDDPRQQTKRFARDLQIRHFQGGFYDWSRGAYRFVADEVIESQVAEFLSDCWYVNKKEIHLRFKPNRNSKAEIMSALRNIRLLVEEPPCWLDGKGHPASEIVSFPNGLLHVPSEEFIPPTANFFTFSSQEFDYDPNAPEPKEWLALLNTIWPDDLESRDCLMQFFGYLLSGDTSLQKILMLVGPPGSGKSTIMRVMEHVLGKDNVVSTDSESLSDRFGLESLIGKSVAFMPDDDFDYRLAKTGVDRMKRISGEDHVSIRRMRQTSVQGKLPVRFVVSTNTIPRLRGSAAAMARRFVILRTPSFDGKVDPRLTDRLCAEAPGILNLAIANLQTLLELKTKLVQPESGVDDLEDIRDFGSSVAAFVNEDCVVDVQAEIERGVLYIHYQGWAEANGMKPVDSREFGRQLKSAVPNLGRGQTRVPGGRVWMHYGIRRICDADEG